METRIQQSGNSVNTANDLEEHVIAEIRNADSPVTANDMDAVLSIFSFAIQMKSKRIVKELYLKGVKKETMLDIVENMLENPANDEIRDELETLRPFVANLS